MTEAQPAGERGSDGGVGDGGGSPTARKGDAREEADPERARRPIFVVGNVKAGTTLVQSLLDGHPELSVLPFELKFFRHLGMPRLSPSNRPLGSLPRWRSPLSTHRQRSPDEVLDDLLSTGELRTFLESRVLPRHVDLRSVSFDSTRFAAELRNVELGDLRDVFVAVADCFRKCAPGATGARRFVEKTPRQEEFAWKLHEWFPEASFVHVLRNPYANVHAEILSGRVQMERRHRVYRPLAKSLYHMERNRRTLPRYRIVRYEDVVERPEKTLRSLARFLDLDFHDSLLEPSFLGVPWRGNSRSTDGSFDGIDPRPARAFLDQIHALDVALVNRYLEPVLRKYGYRVLPDPGIETWLPSPRELPWHYPMNRAMLFTSYL